MPDNILSELNLPKGNSLRPHIKTYGALLINKGYAISTAADKVSIAGEFSRWIEQNGLKINELNEQIVNKFFEFRRQQGMSMSRRHLKKALRELLTHLTNCGVIAVKDCNYTNALSVNLLKRAEGGSLQPYIETYRKILMQKGYAIPTIASQVSVSAQFGRWLDKNRLRINELDEQSVNRFLKFRKRQGTTVRPNRCKKALRGLLLYLKQCGVIPVKDIRSTNFVAELNIFERMDGGLLLPHIETFASVLLAKEYAYPTIKAMVQVVARFSRWLDRNGLQFCQLDERVVQNFVSCQTQRLTTGGRKALHGFLQHLRENSIIPTKSEDNPFALLESNFQCYLVQERGLSKRSIYQYIYYIHQFLSYHFAKETVQFSTLCSADISKFMVQYVTTVSNNVAQKMAWVLRGFLRYLYWQGETTTNLAIFVPKPKKWRLAELPKSLPSEQVEQMLARCDQSTIMGKRDYAILLLLARLGLRAGEVMAMQLEDINWESGEILIRGKGLKLSRLPLLHDVGVALASYLQAGRPTCSTRRVFVRIAPPYRGLRRSSTISQIVANALQNANLDPPRKGAHLLRHSLATQMLREGASLAEISEILRHNSPETTEIYAKVDLRALSPLAQPWPGVTR